MDITPLENMKMLVGENAFHEAESQITRKPKPGIAAQQGWADVNEALEASSDEDSSRLKEGSNKRVVNNFADGPLSRGELCKLATDFCPAIAASRLHFKYKDKRPQGFDEANERYFDKGKFWERKWTLYYISSRLIPNPVLFIPAKEVWDFLVMINGALGLDWGFNRTPNLSGFLLSFEDANSPRPRFLGVSTSKSDFDQLQKSIPGEHSDDSKLIAVGLASGFATTRAFRRRLEMAFALSKVHGKSSKAKELRRMQAKETWCKQLRRTQSYLGLRAADKGEALRAKGQPVMFEEEEEIRVLLRELDLDGSPDIDTTASAPFPFASEVVFVCIDIEAFEGNHSLITEIGVSTLDTKDITIAPGPGGINWMNKIRARHFRIRENASYVNGDYVTGCPDRFEKAFGESEWIRKTDISSTMASCFKHPFSATDRDRETSTTGLEIALSMNEPERSKRNIILVGHNVSADIDFLRKAGYNVKNLSTLVEVLDTANLHRALNRETQPASLATLLQELNIEAWNLHNAGNDAAYTLQALIGIAMKGLQPREVPPVPTIQHRVEKTEQFAAGTVHKDFEGWNVTSDAGEDGDISEPLEL